MADVQIAVIDPEDTQLALAAPAEAVVNVAVPGIQGPIGTTGSVTIAQAGTAAEPGIRFESDTNTGIYSPGADQLAVSTGGTGRLFIGSDGSVGVGGINLATVPLLVRDTGNGVVIQNAASGNYAIGLLAGSGSQDAYVYQRASAPLIFGTSNTEQMRLDSTGRLGLGTSSPSVLLHVSGGVGRISTSPKASSNTYLTLGTTDTSNPMELIFGNSTNSYWSIQSVEQGVANRNLAINPSGGNVGIGTTSPSSTLHVEGTGRFVATNSAIFNGTTGTYTTWLNNGTAVGDIGTGNQAISGGAATDFAITARNTNLVLGTNTTERLRIDSSGRVGIGTTSPGVKLHVADGQIKVANSGAINPTIAFTGNGAGASGFQIGQRYNAQELFIYDTAALADRVVVDAAGRVGIGTTAPTALLDVNADTVRVRTARTPASATATGATGEICWDASYIYVCTATNTWKRAALSTW